MTQSIYDKQVDEMADIRAGLKTTMVTPQEALDALIVHLKFGKDRAIELVDTWGKGNFAPYAVWSKIKETI